MQRKLSLNDLAPSHSIGSTDNLVANSNPRSDISEEVSRDQNVARSEAGSIRKRRSRPKNSVKKEAQF